MGDYITALVKWYNNERGYGFVTREEFIKGGHTVIGCGRSGDAIFDLRMTHGAPHDFSVLDVGLDSKVAIWAAKVLENDSPPDLLINNAAVMNRLAPLWEQDDREFTKLVDAHAHRRGTDRLTREEPSGVGIGVVCSLHDPSTDVGEKGRDACDDARGVGAAEGQNIATIIDRWCSGHAA